MSMQVYDNFLSEEDFLNIKNTMLSTNFPWTYYPYIDYPPDKKMYKDYDHNYQFVHLFYYRYVPRSSFISLLDPVISKINPSAIISMKSNLMTRTEKILMNEMHVDYDYSSSKTAIYYVNTNNGKTIFETGEEIQSVENRFVIFDCNVKHTGTTCTDDKVRCVINFNYHEQK